MTTTGRPGTLLLLLILATTVALGGCSTYGERGWGVRTWQAEPADEMFGRAPHERIQVVIGDSVHRLEGARLEADSVIGFREDDDRWRRVAVHRDQIELLEVKKLNRELTVLWSGLTAALVVSGMVGY